MPEINQKLYEAISADGSPGLVLTDYGPLAWLPEIGDRFLEHGTGNPGFAEQCGRANIRFALAFKPRTSAALQDYFDTAMQAGTLRLVTENQFYRPL